MPPLESFEPHGFASLVERVARAREVMDNHLEYLDREAPPVLRDAVDALRLAAQELEDVALSTARDCDMYRTDRARDALVAEHFYGWRWLRGRYRTGRYLAPPESAEQQLAKGLAVAADGTERQEPSHWLSHTPWNNLPVVPHIVGSLSGARKLLQLLHELEYSSASVFDTDAGHCRVVLWRASYPKVLLADAMAKHEDEAIVTAALQLIRHVDVDPDHHALSFLSPSTPESCP